MDPSLFVLDERARKKECQEISAKRTDNTASFNRSTHRRVFSENFLTIKSTAIWPFSRVVWAMANDTATAPESPTSSNVPVMGCLKYLRITSTQVMLIIKKTEHAAIRFMPIDRV